MYIPDFVCGIVFAVTAECLLVLLGIIALGIRAKIKRKIRKLKKKRQARRR